MYYFHLWERWTTIFGNLDKRVHKYNIVDLSKLRLLFSCFIWSYSPVVPLVCTDMVLIYYQIHTHYSSYWCSLRLRDSLFKLHIWYINGKYHITTYKVLCKRYKIIRWRRNILNRWKASSIDWTGSIMIPGGV